MGMADSPDSFQDGANGILRVCTSLHRWPPLHLKEQPRIPPRKKTRGCSQATLRCGLKSQRLKSTFCALEKCLRYGLSKDKIKPQSNKAQAILVIQPPKWVKQLRHFLGMVHYYRDLWARRSDMLAPLTALVRECGQTKLPELKETRLGLHTTHCMKMSWNLSKNNVHQRAFDHVKATIAREVFLAYPDYSEVFEIYTMLPINN